MYLVVTTIPHFLSILPLANYYNTHAYGYINVIAISSLASMLYHAYEEANPVINFLDYLCAGVWCLYDMYMCCAYANRTTLFKILLGNAIVFSINVQITHASSFYQLQHSLWHLVNAYKCFYVSNLIKTSLQQKTKRTNKWSTLPKATASRPLSHAIPAPVP